MRIAIIGTGAMGSVYAALFSRAGQEVWAVDLWAEHVAALQVGGITLEGPTGVITAPVQATTDIARLPDCDLYVIATKVSGVGPAAQALAAKGLRGQAHVLLIQNGLGAIEAAAAHLPRTQLLLGVAEGFGASLLGPGHARHAAMKRIRIGAPDGGPSDRVTAQVALWQAAGFTVEGYDDIDRLIWEKFLCNVTFSAPCTVFDRTVGALMEDPASWAMALGCMHEAHAIGRARAVRFSFDDAEAYVTAFGTQMPQARPSMLLDHHNKRRSEIDAINGIVPVLGAAEGIATPFNSALSAAVRAREATFDAP